ncbi:PIN domain-containing protein [Candidatus Woesearchaeota archaeon]|nr:PIN domain-containing protein [Candidatus Woesearchaeota archaeon]
MKNKYYIDTCIWRDYFENRKDKFRPLGEWAFKLFKKIILNNEKVIYSEVVVEELLNYFNKEKIKEIFSIVKREGLLEKANITKDQIKEAKKLQFQRKTPFRDTLHSILARDNKSILVTRDKHFNELQNIVKIKKPEELI